MDTATVPAELAHKAVPSNMWLTDAVSGDGASVVFRFRVPDAVRPGLSEYVELQRQATHAFAHLHLGVPLGSRAMLSTVDVRLGASARDDGARASGGRGGELPRAGLVAVHGGGAEGVGRPGRAAGGAVDIDVALRFLGSDGVAAPDLAGLAGEGAGAGALIGSGRITGAYLPQRVYERVRSGARRPEADGLAIPEVPAGCVLEPLSVDAANPILSDHESDHISGMAVVCAAERLAGQHVPDRRLRGLSTRFLSFIETSDPAHVVLERRDGRLLVTVVQRGAPCARSVGELDAAGTGADASAMPDARGETGERGRQGARGRGER